MNKEINSFDDVKILVDTFYENVRKDKLLSPIFNDVIQERWPEHLEKMYHFWQTILLDEHTYNGRPFFPHAKLPIDAMHFERWLELFYTTTDSLFSGDTAVRAKLQAARMASMFMNKLNYFRENTQSKPVL